MCGIFGYYDAKNNPISDISLRKMAETIKYRGPDGLGYYHDQVSAVALGNQRLAILDLEHGQQPFYSNDKSIIVVQNGEIFNHVELNNNLKNDGFLCKTDCDTEVILRLYERDGINGLSLLNGMFAIAIYDKNIDALFLIRDRVGEKPLYYSYDGNRLIYGSEIKSLLEVINHKEPNLNAISQYLTFNYVPPPMTMFKDIKHVMPGTYLKVTKKNIEELTWWNLADITSKKQSDSQWIDEFNSILDDAVRIRLRSDVPFGAFLSGGIDSSTVVGLMSRYLNDPVNTFCIGFNDPKYDESPYADEAAIRFKTNHTLKKVDPNMIDLWQKATFHSDQPHGDISFLPTYKVAELASKKVKMVLTGDGADELYAGYDKYRDFFNKFDDGNSYEEFQHEYINNISLFDDESKKSLFSDNFKKKIINYDQSKIVKALFKRSENMDRINQALYIDTMILLSGNNLVKPDRMGMAVSIENRAPFLDYRMIEHAFSMPGNLKLHKGITKYLYKKAVVPLIGESLAYRKKQMFTVPVGDWFKTNLSELCNDLLLSEKTQERQIFNYDYISELLTSHQNNKKNNTREIRALMALEIWFREFFDSYKLY